MPPELDLASCGWAREVILKHKRRLNLPLAMGLTFLNQPIFMVSEQGMAIGEVNIGNNCWIGSNVIILKGADIGDNCVIGAGAIISGKIPDNTLVRTKNNYETETIQFKD